MKRDLKAENGGQGQNKAKAKSGVKKEDIISMDSIELTVVEQMYNEMVFTLSQNTHILKLKRSYSKACGLPVTRLGFLFDRNRINDNNTPRSLGMEQKDVIDVK